MTSHSKIKFSPFNACTALKVACVRPSPSSHALDVSKQGVPLDNGRAKKKGVLVSRMLYSGAFLRREHLIQYRAGEGS